MKAGEMKQRRDEVITRMLEIEAELKENETPLANRGERRCTGRAGDP